MKKILLISILVMVAFSAVYANDKAFLNSVKGKTFIDTDGGISEFSADGKILTDAEAPEVSLTFIGADDKNTGNYSGTVEGFTLYMVVEINGDKGVIYGYVIVDDEKVDIDPMIGTFE